MTDFVIMFAPAPAKLAMGMQPAFWTIHAPDMDIAIQRAGVLAHGHTGFESNVTESCGDGSVAVYEDLFADAPAGEITIVESRMSVDCNPGRAA